MATQIQPTYLLERRIAQWDRSCHDQCLSQVFPLPVHSITVKEIDLPVEYSDLAIAFSKNKAPPHRSSDCSIDLLPGAMPPKGRIFPLSQPFRINSHEDLHRGGTS